MIHEAENEYKMSVSNTHIDLSYPSVTNLPAMTRKLSPAHHRSQPVSLERKFYPATPRRSPDSSEWACWNNCKRMIQIFVIMLEKLKSGSSLSSVCGSMSSYQLPMCTDHNGSFTATLFLRNYLFGKPQLKIVIVGTYASFRCPFSRNLKSSLFTFSGFSQGSILSMSFLVSLW